MNLEKLIKYKWLVYPVYFLIVVVMLPWIVGKGIVWKISKLVRGFRSFFIVPALVLLFSFIGDAPFIFKSLLGFYYVICLKK